MATEERQLGAKDALLLGVVATVPFVVLLGQAIGLGLVTGEIAATWVGSLGTLLAVVVALGVALHGSMKSRNAESVRAGLIAASIVSRLNSSHRKIAGLAVGTVFLDTTVSTDVARAKSLKQIRDVLETPIWEPSNEVLLALTPLPNNCAHRIASAFDHLALVREEAKRLGDSYIEDAMYDDWRERLLIRWGELLDLSDELLRGAMSELEKARDLERIRPSGEELYGPWDPADSDD